MSDSLNGHHDQSNPDQGPDKPKRKRVAARNVLDLLEGIQSGVINPRSMTQQELLACVEVLHDDLYSTAEIAKRLGYSDRQISRKKAELRQRRSLKFDPNRTAETAGEIEAQMTSLIQRCRRIARHKSASPRDRLLAEKIHLEALNSLVRVGQSLGYLNRVFAKDAQKYESTIESVAKLLHEMERNHALRSADVRRRLKQLREQLEAEGIDIERLLAD